MRSKNLMGSLRSRNISEVIIERIVNSIMSGELRRGEKLPSEEEFAERLGVGRSSVREAVKILEAMGIVEIRRADGTYIVDEFKGQMMNPLLLGLLMAEKSTADIVDFRLLVQEMAFSQLLGGSAQRSFDSCLTLIDRIERKPELSLDEHNAHLLAAELCIGEGIANPLVRELHAKTTQISGYSQYQALTRLPEGERLAFATLLRDLVSSLEDRDGERLADLLGHERSLLMNGSK